MLAPDRSQERLVEEKPTHIALHDVAERRLQEIGIEPFRRNVIFSILPVFQPR